MSKLRKTDYIILVVLLALVIGIVCLVLHGANQSDADTVESQTSSGEIRYTDFDGKRFGIKTGSGFEPVVLQTFPNAEYFYFDSVSDEITALQADKIDAFLEDEPVARMIHVEISSIDYIREPIVDDDYHFAFSKSERATKLMGEFNEYLAEIQADGTSDALLEKWFSSDEAAKTINKTGLTGENGSVTVAVIPDTIPFTYIAKNELQGYAVEIMIGFGRKYGYDIQFEQANITACLAGIAAEKYDVLAGCVSVTEERKETMNFSDVVYNGGFMLMARASDLHPGGTTASVEERPLSYYYEHGSTFGAISGGLYEVKLLERFPDAKVLQFNNQPDMAVAVSSGIIDAFTCPRSSAEDFMKADPTLTCLNEVFMEIPYGFAFQKSKEQEHLRDQMNEFLQKLHADGTYDEIVATWFGDDESVKHVDFSGLTGKNGTIRYITASTMQPFSYIENGKNAGIEVDLVTRFCTEYGYDLKIDNGEFASLIPGITSGTYDIASGTIMITPERAESVNFSNVYYTADAVAVVRKEAAAQTDTVEAEKTSWLVSIQNSFEKNFLRESRWKLIAEGIGTTCIITVLTVIFGSVLAFLICLFRRTDSVLAGKIADIYVKLLQGTPMVVLLMILYYVIFGKSGMPAICVAVIGFSLNFAAYTSETLRSGINGIDGGQREAALALGYSENQAFFRFIFPQAAVQQLPVYRGEIISLLKNTSIVGYIAIQDLTKMSDIIRSRTYEAFFPLIVTAVIYFILAWIISLILKAVLKQIDPRERKRTVKGVTAK